MRSKLADIMHDKMNFKNHMCIVYGQATKTQEIFGMIIILTNTQNYESMNVFNNLLATLV